MMRNSLNLILDDINMNHTLYITCIMCFGIIFFSILIYYEAERNIFYSLCLLVIIYLLIYPFYILIGLDFIGTAIILIYIGAIPILFLFIIMTTCTKKCNNLIISNKPFNKFSNGNHIVLNSIILIIMLFSFIFLNYFIIVHSQYFPLMSSTYSHLKILINPEFSLLYIYFYNTQMIGLYLIKFYKFELYLFSVILLLSFFILHIIFKKEKKT